jgi:uncharacterized membrane protein YhaH (DUF805 family)
MSSIRLSRLGRLHFWLLTLGVWLAFFALRALLALDQPGVAGTVWAGLALAALGALSVARLHDRGRSGWWLATLLVPVAGAAWLTFELALRGSAVGANAWGPDPRES